MVFSVVFMPWYNVKTKTSFITLLEILKQKLPLIEYSQRKMLNSSEIEEDSTSSWQKYRVFLNPNYFAGMSVFACGNFINHTVLALMTEIIQKNDEKILEKGSTVSQVNTQFNISRIAFGCLLKFSFGLLVTFTQKKLSGGDKNLIPFFLHLVALTLCIVGLETAHTLEGMWTLFVAFGMLQATPYFYYYQIIMLCFPFDTHGFGITSQDLIGAFFNFLGYPIVFAYEKTANFDALKQGVWICGFIGALPLILHLPFAFEIGPKWFLKLDERRKQKMNAEASNLCHEMQESNKEIL
ncbi:Oidioi.mRNA.OKI2018_I69.PAR.g10296.t1.cds [Oikopleura dioica]|uniref:Oidioi.mRNA.OKI2018_I69.PAR.g10296.t1.cds n=1 Tax=Oikopleura dioica TaxID=34765 RepID=A0ABN7RXR6_OIKDI|nr:Oidioi.mRNA.OKI2018_I69.PAR.g10296.t1.cds [Oikopleura dioica]